ncbi:hypothetical protein ACS0TY_004923 [Phlomoides rotata]
MSRVPYQILELSIISAQDLEPVTKTLKTYAVASVAAADRRVKTCIDHKGHNNPTWNDKFLFRIDDKTLNSDTSFVAIEIFAVGWLRDTSVGSVTVLISSLIPPSARHDRRFLALQIRRPSGRPQGILNLGVSLLDNTMRSMPLCTELSGSTVGFQDLWDKSSKGNGELKKLFDSKTIRLQRSASDKTDVTRKQWKKKNGPGSVATGAGLGSVIDNGFGSVVSGGHGGGVNGGSMVNGSVCNSDLGPSASVVAAAVAMGLYPIHQGPPPRPGSSVLEDWTVEETPEDGVMTRIERWKMDLPQGYDPKYQRLGRVKMKEKKRRHQRRRTYDEGGEEEDDGRFKCFGTALGCEFTIVCGGGNNKKGGRKNRRRSKSSDSEL